MQALFSEREESGSVPLTNGSGSGFWSPKTCGSSGSGSPALPVPTLLYKIYKIISRIHSSYLRCWAKMWRKSRRCSSSFAPSSTPRMWPRSSFRISRSGSSTYRYRTVPPICCAAMLIWGAVSVSDPDWIRILSGQWIRIRIQEGKNDPQNYIKLRNVMFWSSGRSLRAEGFFCSLDVLSGGLGIGKL